ncbi:MAG: hypothetical protein ACTHLK_06215, partial [Brucella intermedia]
GGLLIGVLASVIVALIFSLLVVTMRANEVVVGLALNIMAGGLTISLTKAIFGTRGSIVSPDIVGRQSIFHTQNISVSSAKYFRATRRSSISPLSWFSWCGWCSIGPSSVSISG